MVTKRAKAALAADRRHNSDPPPKPKLKPTIVDRIPPGWYASEASSPPPRPVDQDSGLVPQYRLFSIPDPSGKKGKRMEILVTSARPQAPGVQPIPNVTHPPYKATWLPKSGTFRTPPLPMGKEASVKMPNGAPPKAKAAPPVKAALPKPKRAPTPIPVRFAEPVAPKPAAVHPVYAAAAAAVSARKPTGARRKML